MSKVLLIDVSCRKSTQLYIRVPDDFKGWPNHEVLRKAAKETVTYGEWEEDYDFRSIEADEMTEVTEEEASAYKTYDAT